ncbi:Immunoglobulin-binding protein 1, partial [Caligus rogercresseyi]
REDKIRKYKEKKAIEDELEDLHAGVLSSAQRDEDALRKYYLSLIHRFALLSLEELNSFKSEMEILHFMAKNKRSLPQASSEPPPKKPFKPIIITRDEAQKRVFGLGYSSVPIYSVEEFYEQRVRDGWFPSPEEVAVANENSLKDEASNPERALQMAEAEDEESENAIERDDEDKLIRMRAMDDYKDTHKRGEGNRYNMG